jgi:aminoglycoside phosphotransferase (APT) family kinase protein
MRDAQMPGQTARVDFPDDAGLVAVLNRFAVGADAMLGHGGEAWVYALDDERVLRVLHAGGRTDDVTRRQVLVDELVRSAPAFALPEVVDMGELDGRVYAIERRLPGRSVMDELRVSEGRARARLIEAHLDAAAALGDLHLEPRDTYGDLIADDPITTPTWRAYLEQRAATNLAASLPEFRSIDAAALASALPEPSAPAFVHLDTFAGNMLTDGSRITAVLDFGPTTVAGDRRLDPLSAAVYLASPDITPAAVPADVDVAMSWLRTAGLDGLYEPARRWLAAFWSFAVDDPRVLRFCRDVLVGSV